MLCQTNVRILFIKMRFFSHQSFFSTPCMSDDWKCLMLYNTKSISTSKSKSFNYEEATGHSNEIDNGDARTWIPLLGINTITQHDGAADTAKGFPRTSCTSSDRNPLCLFSGHQRRSCFLPSMVIPCLIIKVQGLLMPPMGSNFFRPFRPEKATSTRTPRLEPATQRPWAIR